MIEIEISALFCFEDGEVSCEGEAIDRIFSLLETGELGPNDFQIDIGPTQSLTPRKGRTMTIYQTLRDMGATMDSHESDLHVVATPDIRRAVREAGIRWTEFRDETTGRINLEIPFAYDPFWENRRRDA